MIQDREESTGKINKMDEQALEEELVRFSPEEELVRFFSFSPLLFLFHG